MKRDSRRSPPTGPRAARARPVPRRRSKMRPLPNRIWLTRIRSWSPLAGRGEEALGEIVERLGGDGLELEPAVLGPARELAPRASGTRRRWSARAAGAGRRAGTAAARRMRKSWVLAANTIADRIAAAQLGGDMAPAPRATPRPSPGPICGRRAAPHRPSIRPGRRSWRRATDDGCARRSAAAPGAAPRLLENSGLKLTRRSSATTVRGRRACRASSCR